MHERIEVPAPDGRSLDVVVAGPPDGPVVLAHHGSPGSPLLLSAQIRAGEARGLRHVSYARPGYSGSDRAAGRTIADCAADAAAVLDAVGAGSCVSVGWSGGGPHALACAALLGGRVRAAASIAGVAPYEAEGLDWTAGMGKENVAEFGAAVAGEDALLPYLREQAEQLAVVTGADLAGALGDLVDDVDRAALSGEVADELAAQLRDALREGVWGWLDDDLAFTRPWGFDLAAVNVPVAIWQGGQDRMVPAAHGPWLAEHVPGAQAHFHERHGHISLVSDDYGEVLDALAGLSGASGPTS
jgi:pimeloyl-ACP methyl ester carboxylesterase